MLRHASYRDLDDVVEVHIAAFPDFFLTLLGPKFLFKMYQIFLENKGSVFIVEEKDGNIFGFAVGMESNTKSDKILALKKIFSFSWIVFAEILKNPVALISRIFKKIVFSKKLPPIPSDAVFLRSIGVNPRYQGKGVATRLINEIEKKSIERGASSIVLTTDANNNEGPISFYKKNGYKVKDTFYQDKSRKMFFMTKDISKIVKDN